FSGSWYTSDLTGDYVFWHQGVWNPSTTKVDWTASQIDMAPYLMKNSDNTLAGFLGWANSASAKDGSVSYVLMKGIDVDNTVHPAYCQVLIKSTDGGVTWQHVPYFDLGTLPEIQAHILPTAADPNVYAPTFSVTASATSNKFEADIIVDALGKPHIFAEVRGSYSINPDSLGYVWVGPDGYPVDNNVFELYMDENDNWHAVWVDSLSTDNLLDENSTWSGSTSGSIGWTHRIQASMTPDQSKIMVSWTDSDYKTWGTDREDFNPDLMIWGRDVYSYLNTPVINVTAGDPNLWGMAFFHYLAPESWVENNAVHMPVTVEDILTNNSPDLPVYHNFVQDVTLNFSDFTLGGAPSPTAIGSSSIGTCHPNPFRGTTSLDVTVNTSSPVTVTILNTTGQTVSSVDYGVLASGTHTLQIDGSTLSSGVYFCKVKIGDQQQTSKMIVQ
ncbi:MAG TPA: T9SS type A sorting domain-containing protein, partial [Bacteroidales bacterium]|nr:T9SS type A sorting domain-containing protein [Bacteroidales bacterium]